MTVSSAPPATPGAKMLYLIKRRPETSREELVAHWFANHMPGVIAAQQRQAGDSRPHARRYIATLWSARADGSQPWDGVAQLWWDKALPRPRVPHGTKPRDSFQQKAEPYLPWATTEYVVMDPASRLSVVPLTLNDPFPTTRSGFHKVSFLVGAKPGTNFDDLFAHWLNVHVPNVAGTMREVGGFGYVVSHSLEPAEEPYAGLAELYFDDADGWTRYKQHIQPDGMERWIDGAGVLVLQGNTEMIGIA